MKKILIGNAEMIEWGNCGLPGSQVLIFQIFCLSIMSYISEYICAYEHAFQEILILPF